MWLHNVRHQKLEVGDYTTELLLNKFHVERKSPQDLYGSIIQGHERFKSMFLRAYAHETKCPVYVECSEQFFYSKRWPQGYKRKTPGNVLAKIIYTLNKRYGIQFVWCTDRTEIKQKITEEFRHQESLL